MERLCLRKAETEAGVDGGGNSLEGGEGGEGGEDGDVQIGGGVSSVPGWTSRACLIAAVSLYRSVHVG